MPTFVRFLRRALLVLVFAGTLTVIAVIWKRAPSTTTLIAALIGAVAIVFKDTLTNLIAGVMLMWSGTFRVGDVIRLDPSLAKSTPEPYVIVAGINILHIAFHERDGMQILIPNSQLVSTTVWRCHPGLRRLALSMQMQTQAGVNFQKAKQVLLEVCEASPRVLKEPWPRVRLAGFVNGRTLIVLRFWIDDPENGISNIYAQIIEHASERMAEEGIDLIETFY